MGRDGDRARLATIDADYATLVGRCLEKDRDRRPSSAVETAATLDSILRREETRTAVVLPARRERAVVVLPFRVTSKGDAALGEVVAQELTDVLCTIQELRVLASSAAARFTEERDPRRIHEALSVDAIVDGTIQIDGERVRITARLIETPSGKQQW